MSHPSGLGFEPRPHHPIHPHRGEDLSGLLDGGDLLPAPLLEEFHPGGIVECGRRVSSEERRKALSVRQGW